MSRPRPSRFFNPKTNQNRQIMSTTPTEEFPWEKSPSATKPAKKTAAKAPTEGTITITDLEPVAAGEGPPIEGVPRADLPAIRENIEKQLAGLLTQADAIKVTSIDQTDLMSAARAARLNIRQVRLFVEKKHTELKAYHLQAGREVDAFKNHFLALCKEREERLQLAEDFAEHETARIQGELRVNRLIELKPFLADGQSPMADLGTLEEKDWLAMLEDAKDLHGLKVARIAREEKEREDARIAEEQRLERERQEREAEAARIRAEAEEARKENERLRAEQEAERKRVAAETARIEAERAAERRKAQEEREAQERALQAERDAAERERQQAEAAARAERERLQREAAAKAAEQQKLIDEANRKAQELERQAAEREAAERMAEAQRTAAAAEAARQAAAAPDREKVIAYAHALEAIPLPKVTTAAGKALVEKLAARITNLAAAIKDETAKF